MKSKELETIDLFIDTIQKRINSFTEGIPTYKANSLGLELAQRRAEDLCVKLEVLTELKNYLNNKGAYSEEDNHTRTEKEWILNNL